MDSLNMRNLASTLPPSAIAKMEQDTMDKFKAAAQSLTLLYRSSQRAAKRHFDAGYATALEDVLSVIHHDVSIGSDTDALANGGYEAVSIGRILDWIEARRGSIRLKAREEEEEEEERETRTRAGSATKPSVETFESGDTRDKTAGKAIHQNASPSPTIPVKRMTARQTPDEHPASPTEATESSPSPAFHSPSVRGNPASQALSTRPQTRARVRSQQVLAPLNAASVTSSTISGSSMASIIGAKRRHAAMMLDSSIASPVAISIPASENSFPLSALGDSAPQLSDGLAYAGNPGLHTTSGQRRRVRNSRSGLATMSENAVLTNGHAFVGDSALMDIEDDSGRDRKRIARR